MKFTNEDVQQILQLLDATKYDELHLETERFKLTIRRSPETGEWTQETQFLSGPNAVRPSSAVPAGTLGAIAEDAVSLPESRQSGWIEVRAHLPGTFYRAAKPGAPSFVEIGASIHPDTVVGIIETMKLMNAVHAQARGEVVEICVVNGQFVEKGTVLMRIRLGAV